MPTKGASSAPQQLRRRTTCAFTLQPLQIMCDILCSLRRLHADPNAQDQLGETPLHYAALAGQSAAAALLLEAKADKGEHVQKATREFAKIGEP